MTKSQEDQESAAQAVEQDAGQVAAGAVQSEAAAVQADKGAEPVVESAAQAPQSANETPVSGGAPSQITDVAALNDQLSRYRAELLDVRNKLREADEKLRAEHDLRVRAAADLENYRRRAMREREETAKFGQERLLKEILPVIDNLERALDPKNSADVASLRTGVEMTHKMFENALAHFGLKGFSAMGKPFDPAIHEAMQAVESDEEPGTVVAEMVRGFMLHERLLRPAMVFVAKPRTVPAPRPQSDESSETSSGAEKSEGAQKADSAAAPQTSEPSAGTAAATSDATPPAPESSRPAAPPSEG